MFLPTGTQTEREHYGIEREHNVELINSKDI